MWPFKKLPLLPNAKELQAINDKLKEIEKAVASTLPEGRDFCDVVGKPIVYSPKEEKNYMLDYSSYMLEEALQAASIVLGNQSFPCPNKLVLNGSAFITLVNVLGRTAQLSCSETKLRIRSVYKNNIILLHVTGDGNVPPKRADFYKNKKFIARIKVSV